MTYRKLSLYLYDILSRIENSATYIFACALQITNRLPTVIMFSCHIMIRLRIFMTYLYLPSRICSYRNSGNPFFNIKERFQLF